MNINGCSMGKGEFDHLIYNLEKKSIKKSIFNYKSGQRSFLSLGQGSFSEWLDKLLPNTRLIIEPKIIGKTIGIQYINGELNKAINENSLDITDEICSNRTIPKKISIKKRLEIQGVLYNKTKESDKPKPSEFQNINKKSTQRYGHNFSAFQIFDCKINHYQALQELKRLDFEIPETQFTKFTSDIEIYRQCWKEGKLFQSYPTSGIVVKINSRKLQKHLGENNLSINWAYSIN